MINWLKRKIAVYRLEKALDDYVRTLSPERQQWANDLRKRLSNASSDQRASIMLAEVKRVHEQQMRLTEKVERLAAKS